MAYNNNRGKPRQTAPEFNVPHERELYYAYLNDPANKAEFKKALGPDVNLDRWLASARDAVEHNPGLLDPAMRTSLLFAVKKAAQQTLKPDNKQGAIIPRYNKDAGAILASWQPMVQGVLLLGRRAGVLKSIVSADLVFAGEPFKRLAGDKPEIIHEVKMDVREEAYEFLRRPYVARDQNAPPDPDAEKGGPDHNSFWDRVVGAYAIVESPDGSRTRRTMGRSRLLLVRDFARKSGGAGWNGPFVDEFILKTVLLFTMKHVDTVPKDEHEAAHRLYREALEQDMDGDFDDDEGDVIDSTVEAAPRPRALAAPNPMDKLNTMEARFGNQREPVQQGQDQQGQGQQNDRQREPDQGRQQGQQTGQGQPTGQQGGGQTKPPASSGKEVGFVETVPGLNNDDDKREGLSDDEIATIRSAKNWARSVILKDLPKFAQGDILSFERNEAVGKKMAWMEKNAPATRAAVLDALAARKGELMNSRDAA